MGAAARLVPILIWCGALGYVELILNRAFVWDDEFGRLGRTWRNEFSEVVGESKNVWIWDVWRTVIMS